MNILETRMYEHLKRKGLAARFERPGIYCILLDGQHVYIGKSGNMLIRMAQHYTQLKKPTEHKYSVLADAARKGHSIRFCVLYYASATDKDALEKELGAAEGEYIRAYRPPLNYQIPKAEDWRKYDINPKAKSITLAELLGGGNSE